MAGLSLRRAAAAAVAAFAALASAACNRTEILGTVNEYLQGLTTGLTHPIRNAGTNFKNIENNKTLDIKTGVMSKGLTLDYNRTIVDTVDCATHTEIIGALSLDHFTKYVIGVQIRHSPEDNRVFEVDSVVTTNGSWFFNATSTLLHARAETKAGNWDTQEPAKRSSRTELKRVADAYLDMWTNKSAIAAIPFGTGCRRLEGGNYYGCTAGIPTNNSQLPNSHRRYVIDEAVGSVDVISIWEHLNDTIDNHEFRLESGKLQWVHAMAWTDNRRCAEEKEGWRCR